MANLGTCQRDQYLQASYNGVAFTAKEVSSEHGRRSAIGEFPFSNETGFADMGRKVRRYNIEARLDENDHQARSAALIAACELTGPGILVHPTRGVLNVTCDSLTVRNDIIEEQGVTYVSMVFIEANLWENGFGLVGSLLGLVLRPLLEASSASFLASYSVRSEPVYLQGAVTEQAEATAEKFREEYIRQGDPDARAAADLQQVADDPALANDAETMDNLVRLGASAISQNADDAQAQYDSFRRTVNWAIGAQTTGTDSGEALTSHTRITAGSYMARAALDRDYANSGQALAVLDQVTAVLNQEADIAYQRCDNALFLELRKFVADFTRQMYNIAYGTPRRQEYNFMGAVSPLAAAYAIWDDATRSREISTDVMTGPIVQAVP